MVGKYNDKPTPGVVCCFCKTKVEEKDIDPCDITITANADKEPEKDQEQYFFWCHFECFCKKVHPIVETAFLDPLKEKKGEIITTEGACSFCLQPIEINEVEPCNIHFATSWYKSRSEQRRCNLACHLGCLRKAVHEYFIGYLVLDT